MFLLSWTDVLVALANGVAGVALAAPAFLALSVGERHLGPLFSIVGVAVFIGTILIIAARNRHSGSVKHALGERFHGFASCCDLFIHNSLRDSFWADTDLSGGSVPVEICTFATYLAGRGLGVDLSTLVSYLAQRRRELLRTRSVFVRQRGAGIRPIKARSVTASRGRLVGHSA